MKNILKIARGVLMFGAPLIFFGPDSPALGGPTGETIFATQESPPGKEEAPVPAKDDAKPPVAGDEMSKIREFAPGVHLDWATKSVELDARVVLREGPLELLACSPQTKEHESVLVVLARPLQVFQALGLIGLQAGSPPRFDEKLDRWIPASGEPLDLRVRWKAGDSLRTVRAAQWMIEPRSGKPPETLIWVFAGSFVHDEGGFAADSEGTVVSVVDFESALIAPSVRHSADDEELWLVANKEEVPPPGTRCTLIVRSAYHPRLEADLDAKGELVLEGNPQSIEETGRLLLKDRDDRTPFLFVRVHGGLDPAKSKKVQDELRAELVRRKLDPETSMRFRVEHDKSPPPNHSDSPRE